MQSDDALSDAALNQELERAFSIEPSPDFVARVRMRTEGEPAPSVWRFSWLACCAGGAIVALMVVAIAPRNLTPVPGAAPSVGRTSSGGTSPELSKAASSFGRTDAPPTAARAEPPYGGPRRSVRRAAIASVKVEGRTTEAADSDVEVLVDVRESNAILRLMLAIRDGRVPVVQPELAVSIESAPLTQIVIPPLTIDPIGPADGRQGVRP